MRSSRTSRARLLAAVALAAVALGAAGCNRHEPIGQSRIAVDARERHPIVLARTTQSAQLEVGVHTQALSGIQRADVEAFGRAFRTDGEGSLAISVPAGSVNETAAVRAAREVRAILVQVGVPSNAINYRPVRPESGVAAPPLTLSYIRLRARVPHRCRANTDLDMQSDWRQPVNFGCADQTNFAAMIANPNDLETPRPLDRPYAQRRYGVLDRYGQAQDPSTASRDENRGVVSRVGR